MLEKEACDGAEGFAEEFAPRDPLSTTGNYIWEGGGVILWTESFLPISIGTRLADPLARSHKANAEGRSNLSPKVVSTKSTRSSQGRHDLRSLDNGSEEER